MKTAVAIIVLVLALMGAGIWWVIAAMRDPPPPVDKVVQVQLVRPPPPVPPPPPPPPPPETQVDIPEPQETPDIPEPNLEPAPDAGIDGPPGNDAFGMQRGGTGGGASGPYSLQAHQQWFAQKARDRIRALLSRRAGIKKGSYKIPIRLWVDTEGSLERFELLRTTGDTEVDREIEAALGEFGRMSERRPPELPPFRVRVEFSASGAR